MTPRQKAVLKQLSEAPQGLYYNDLFPPERKSNMPTLILKGWAEYSVRFGVYEITENGRKALTCEVSAEKKDKQNEES